MTLNELKQLEGLQWKHIERDLTEILATNGEPPLYLNRLNRLRAGKRPTAAELKALIEWSGGAVESYKD
jgi:hypothetical protein